MSHPEEVSEVISHEEAADFLEDAVEGWFTYEHSVELNNLFALQIAHWTAETFGQEDNNGVFWLSTQYGGREEIYGFSGEELPTGLQQLVHHYYNGELYLQNENTVDLVTSHDCIEVPPHIPNWDEIKKLQTFNEQLEAVRSNPQILSGVVPTKAEVLPQVAVRFEPARYFHWGLEFITNELGTRVAPYGARGSTWASLNYVIETRENQRELAETVSRLSLLAARHTEKPSSKFIPAAARDVLTKRLAGEDTIPLNTANLSESPGNAIENLIIRSLSEEGLLE